MLPLSLALSLFYGKEAGMGCLSDFSTKLKIRLKQQAAGDQSSTALQGLTLARIPSLDRSQPQGLKCLFFAPWLLLPIKRAENNLSQENSVFTI